MKPEPMIGEEDVADAMLRARFERSRKFPITAPPDRKRAYNDETRLVVARAAISAHLAALEGAGWRCVPVEPTDEMCDAATRSTSAWLNSKLQGVALRRLKLQIRWRAMLAAAPPPQNSDEVKP